MTTEIEKLEETALTLRNQATAIKVTNNLTRIQAAELGKIAKDLAAQITERHEVLIKLAHAAHKEAIRVRDIDLVPVNEVVKICRDSINAYDQEQQRLERIEQARLQKIEEERAAKERERLLNAAIKAKSEEKQETLLEQAEMVYVAPVTVAPTVAKTVQTSAGNITQAKEVTVSVANLKLFVTALCEQNPGALATILDVKVSGLKSFVKANGLEQYPGLSISHGTSVRF